MAETKQITEREYIVPLRRSFLKVQRYNRTSKAIKELKEFIARHMKVPERDLSKIKLDVHLNNELWFKGRKNPPSKIKVKETKDGDVVKVEFVEIPQHLKFLKVRLDKIHKKPDKKEKKEEVKEEKTDEQKKNEKEKEQSVAEQRTMQAQQDANVQKHLTAKKDPGFHRMALKK